jgi:hypothetical protein
MFEEIMREVRKLAQPREFNIPVQLDERGYYDRACHNQKCLGHFKVMFEDWKNKIAEGPAFCPFCRHQAPAEDWNTQGQQEYFVSAARAEMSRLVNSALERGVRRTQPQHFGGGLLGVSLKLSFTPGTIPPVIPTQASTAFRQDFTCEACACRYTSVGASFFCPACGHNSAVSCFDNTLETVRRTIEALPELRVKLEETAGADAAKDTTRQLLEDQFPRLVGAFERVNEALFEKLPSSQQITLKGAVFQRIDDAASAWQAASGRSYGDFLDSAELSRLKLSFQRRHVLSHRQGVVDQAYLDRSGDHAYAVGQRLVVHDQDVMELIRLLSKLVIGLRSVV